MKVNIEKVRQYFLLEKGWSEPMFATKMNLDYSYVYRIFRGEREGGKKFYEGFFTLCKELGLDIYEFLS